MDNMCNTNCELKSIQQVQLLTQEVRRNTRRTDYYERRVGICDAICTNMINQRLSWIAQHLMTLMTAMNLNIPLTSNRNVISIQQKGLDKYHQVSCSTSAHAIRSPFQSMQHQTNFNHIKLIYYVFVYALATSSSSATSRSCVHFLLRIK